MNYQEIIRQVRAIPQTVRDFPAMCYFNRYIKDHKWFDKFVKDCQLKFKKEK